MNWPPPVTDQELDACDVHAGIHEEVAGGLGGPWAGGVGGDAEQVRTAATVFEHDQGVDAFEIDGVDVQEVDSDDVLGLGSEELPPGCSGATWGGVDTGPIEDGPHGGGGHLVAEAGEFAVDAPMALSRVLGRHAQDQGSHGGGRWRASGSAPLAIVPLPRDQFAVPGQQRGRGHREDLSPEAAWYQVREGGEPQAVGWFVA
ncbi:hypothetical protein ACFRNJ_30905 [Streptomyces sp. NPDC056721]|uniref:hypothetical protein n=1 Tax=Streptomyces sp. NPDC056721 TaxID=3345923 RepID=UPI00369A242D